MNNIFRVLLAVFIFIFFIFASGMLYVIDETQQVVVTQFGEPIGDPVTGAGLHYKLPFIQNANYFDRRILSWNGDPNEIQTLEKRNIWVDVTARWRIVDALKFMQSVSNEVSAQTRLDDVIDGATRDVIASHIQREAIRNTNGLIQRNKEIELGIIDPEFQVFQVDVDPIQVGREKIARMIREQSTPLVRDLGIELVDVLIKRINYIESVQARVYERMISERNAAAAQIRSEGQGKKMEIEGTAAKELKEIESEAYRKSQEIMGTADAEAIRIYAEAFNRDPEFYSFLKTLEAYQSTIKSSTTLIMTTDNEFYQTLNGTSVKP